MDVPVGRSCRPVAIPCRWRSPSQWNSRVFCSGRALRLQLTKDLPIKRWSPLLLCLARFLGIASALCLPLRALLCRIAKPGPPRIPRLLHDGAILPPGGRLLEVIDAHTDPIEARKRRQHASRAALQCPSSLSMLLARPLGQSGPTGVVPCWATHQRGHRHQGSAHTNNIITNQGCKQAQRGITPRSTSLNLVQGCRRRRPADDSSLPSDSLLVRTLKGIYFSQPSNQLLRWNI